MSLPFFDDVEVVNCITKQTCLSPKKDIYNRLQNGIDVNTEIIDRFKHCAGKPVYRVVDVDGSSHGKGARGACIVCKSKTNWYCALCRNWACNTLKRSGNKYCVDANIDKDGHRVTVVKTCFMDCRPDYL